MGREDGPGVGERHLAQLGERLGGWRPHEALPRGQVPDVGRAIGPCGQEAARVGAEPRVHHPSLMHERGDRHPPASGIPEPRQEIIAGRGDPSPAAVEFRGANPGVAERRGQQLAGDRVEPPRLAADPVHDQERRAVGGKLGTGDARAIREPPPPARARPPPPRPGRPRPRRRSRRFDRRRGTAPRRSRPGIPGGCSPRPPECSRTAPIARPEATDQNRAVPSPCAVSNISPSGLNEASSTRESWRIAGPTDFPRAASRDFDRAVGPAEHQGLAVVAELHHAGGRRQVHGDARRVESVGLPDAERRGVLAGRLLPAGEPAAVGGERQDHVRDVRAGDQPRPLGPDQVVDAEAIRMPRDRQPAERIDRRASPAWCRARLGSRRPRGRRARSPRPPGRRSQP